MATTAKSKSTSAKGKGRKADLKEPARPFDPDTVAVARTLAERYQVVLWHEDGDWYGRGLELPGIMADGPTPDACVRELREALVYAVATLMEIGEPVPSPASASDGRRTEQVNLRLTAAERVDLEAVARAAGFPTVSDFVRAAAVEKAASAGAGRPAEAAKPSLMTANGGKAKGP